MDSCKGFLFVVAWSRMGKSSQPSRWHRVSKRREARGEGKVSKYEMRIIIRAYLAASGMQRSPPFFWHAPCLPFDRPLSVPAATPIYGL